MDNNLKKHLETALAEIDSNPVTGQDRIRMLAEEYWSQQAMLTKVRG